MNVLVEYKVDITIIRNRSKKGVKVEKILIGSERVGRVHGGHHNSPKQSVFSLLLILVDYGYGLL
jgi:DNA-binding protein